MIIETRVFNKATGRMVYMGILKPSDFCLKAVTPSNDPKDYLKFDPSDPIMLKTPILDKESKQLWEGDIVDCGVITSYGAVRERGVVVWRADLNCFTININRAYEERGQFDVVDALKIGNLYENPEMFTKQMQEKQELIDKQNVQE